MRKKIISFLFFHKFLNWVLPIFHMLIGHNKISIGRGNIIDCTTTNLYCSIFDIQGEKNSIKMGKLSDFHTSSIVIKGNNNSIIIGDYFNMANTSISVSGNNNRVIIGSKGYVTGLQLIIEDDNNLINIGDEIFVMGDTRIYCVQESKFTMEEGCMLSDHIEIRTTDNHSIIDLNSGLRINYEEDIVLHKRVWVGTGVTILKGTEVAEGCIVGAASVLTKKYLTAHAIIAGNPGKVIRKNVDWKMSRI